MDECSSDEGSRMEAREREADVKTAREGGNKKRRLMLGEWTDRCVQTGGKEKDGELEEEEEEEDDEEEAEEEWTR